MDRESITAAGAPRAIGPYSQAIRSGNLIFCSGQVALDAATGKLIEGGIDEQTRRVLKNLSEVLTAAGSSLKNVVKTTVYLHNLKTFPEMNKIYAEFFPESPPARATVEVSALPAGAAIEIDCIAIREP